MKCYKCDGTGIVSLGKGIRGVKRCDVCNGSGTIALQSEDGYYFKAEKIYKSKVCVRPIAHHYEDAGETEYIKYGCPVCETFGCRHSIYFGRESCPICGVNLFWDDNEEVETQ